MYAKIGLWGGGVGFKKYYWRANLLIHHAFKGKQIFYCGLGIAQMPQHPHHQMSWQVQDQPWQKNSLNPLAIFKAPSLASHYN